MKVSTEVILASYERTGSVHKTAKEVGITHDAVWRRMKKIGKIPDLKTPPETVAIVQAEYDDYRRRGEVRELAKRLGLTLQAVYKIANRIGIGARIHKQTRGKWMHMTEDGAQALFDEWKNSGHPVSIFCRLRKVDRLGFSRTLQRFFPAEYEATVEANQPKQGRYRRGRAFEYVVRDHLKSIGYVCFRSPMSRSPVDLAAIRADRVLFVQCKKHGVLGPKEWNEIFDMSLPVKAVPLLARRKGYRDIEYLKLTDRKDGSKKRQPFEDYSP